MLRLASNDVAEIDAVNKLTSQAQSFKRNRVAVSWFFRGSAC